MSSWAVPADDHFGAQKTLVLLTRRSTDECQQPVEVALVEARIDSLKDWIEENSFDYAAGTPGPKSSVDADVVGWLDLPGAASIGRAGDFTQALIEAKKDGVAVETYDRLILLTAGPRGEDGPQAQCESCVGEEGVDFSQASTGAGRTPTESHLDPEESGYFPDFCAYWSWLYCVKDATAADIVHEYIHNFGLNHARSQSSVSSELWPYGNQVEVMGAHNDILDPQLNSGEPIPHIQAANKEALGWMGTVPTASSSSGVTYKIGPLEKALDTFSGSVIHALRIPQNSAPSGHKVMILPRAYLFTAIITTTWSSEDQLALMQCQLPMPTIGITEQLSTT